jgi:plastocyanin
MSIFKIQIRAGNPAVFNPSPLSVRVNDSIFWSNDDQTHPHWPTPNAATPKAWLDFQIAPGGQSAQISINPMGPTTLNYVCSLHPGEKGQIKVVGKKKGAFGGKTKKGAFAGKTKKGALATVTKRGALAAVKKRGAVAKITKKGAFGKKTR